MNAIDLLKVMVVAGCVAVTSTAWSQQSTDTTANPPAMTTSDAKAVKQANRRLGRDVRRALAKAQGFDVSNVFVRARDGNVTLTGTVPESGQIAQAATVAQGVNGVKSVTNKITLGIRRGGGGN
ncbi:BON domain-containing protein [Paraburkholderia rhizosphaerae]|uniref:BON domain-containing protein n=1 Tax=Paraburkholderia rhizosphaerae TaxID=480658 RepID=A0A4R8M2A0_9BURK|nr:BON domain-containing protein [Paraburkholderia rhizosphaerae]TDY53420.1 BON domain-containing protein [Paraburkholderia rhizosphaerae]